MKVPVPVRPKKKWGQNFLTDQNVIEKIIHYIDPKPDEDFLEVGPGTGALTTRLVSRVRTLTVIELDQDLVAFISQTPGIEVIAGDVLKVDFVQLGSEGKNFRVAANLPYYISTPVFTKFLQSRKTFSDLTLMFQNEVAVRILAQPGDHDYSMLSVLAQYYSSIDKGFIVSRNSFTPRPDIDSRVMRFTMIREERLPFTEYSAFLAGAFAQRRKKLRNNLNTQLKYPFDVIDQAFEQLNLRSDIRAENLSAQQYEHLIQRLKSHA